MYALIARDRKPLWLRLLVVLLVLFVLLASPLQVVGEAHAIAIIDDLTIAGAVAIVSVVLVAAGMIYENQDALHQAAQAIYDKYIAPVDDLVGEIAGLATSWLTGSKLSAGAYGIRLSVRLYDAILGSHAADIQDGIHISDGQITISAWDDTSLAKLCEYRFDGTQKYSIDFYRISNGRSVRHIMQYDGTSSSYEAYVNDVLLAPSDDIVNKGHFLGFDRSSYNGYTSINAYFSNAWDISHYSTRAVFFAAQKEKSNSTYYPVDYSCRISGIEQIIAYSGSIAAPAPDTLLKMPDIPQEDADGKVIYPSIPLVPEENLIRDLPETAADKKITDLPYDKVIDVSTGAAVGEQAGTDAGTGEQAGTDAGTLGKIGTAIAGFFDSPKDFKLNFDAFKNSIIPDRFPFSIPFDFVNAIKTFAVAAKDFQLKIDLDTDYFSIHHTVDLSPFMVVIAFFRYVCVIWFCLILIVKTRDLIKW